MSRYPGESKTATVADRLRRTAITDTLTVTA
jgi:hypothetical protein